MIFNHFNDITFIQHSANDNVAKSNTNSMTELYHKMVHLCDMLASIERKIMDDNIIKIAHLPNVKGCQNKLVEYIESNCHMLSLKVKRKMISRAKSLYDSKKITPCQFDTPLPV